MTHSAGGSGRVEPNVLNKQVPLTVNKGVPLEVTIKAANEGNSEAQWIAGYHYCKGERVAQDYKKGVEFFRKAQGHPRAQFGLGLCYQNGLGVTKDLQIAAELFTNSAAQGFAPATQALQSLPSFSSGTAATPTRSVESSVTSDTLNRQRFQ